MNLIFISDNENVNSEADAVFREIPDLEYTIASGEEVLENRNLEIYDIIAVNGPTWQRHFSIFRYFGLMDVLDRVPVLFLSKAKRSQTHKGRLGKKDVVANLPLSADTLQKFLDDYRLNKDLMENLARASMMVQ